MRRKRKVLVVGVGIAVVVAILGTTTMSASTQFVTPADAASGEHAGEWVNLEGVATDLERADGTLRFRVRGNGTSVPVVYDGPTPDTMQEGRVVVAKGRLADGRLDAAQLSVRAHEGTRPEEAGS